MTTNNLKIIQILLRIIVSGLISLLLLSFFSLFYYNNGIRKTSITGATDYSWENSFWSIGYEGYAIGFYDKDGYNNPEVINPTEMDILVMGSSQMNGYNVSSGNTACDILNKKFVANMQNLKAYNIGIEGHDIYINADNMDNALSYYQPQKYLILQIGDINLDQNKVDEVVNGTRIRSSAYDTGVVYYLQKIPYFRLFAKQLRDFTNKSKSSKNINVTTPQESHTQDYTLSAHKLLDAMSNECTEHGVSLIIVFLPSVCLDEYGNLVSQYNKENEQIFKSICDSNGINYINMEKSFENEFLKNRHVPYGFSNGRLCSGHLNKYGHFSLGSALYDEIQKLEKQ